jgi:ankyrin repeat domain-containing protein 50
MAMNRLYRPKANVDAQEAYHRRTALQEAARNGHEAVMRLLLEAMADVDAKDEHVRTPLQLAAENGHEKAVRLLLKAKADVKRNS